MKLNPRPSAIYGYLLTKLWLLLLGIAPRSTTLEVGVLVLNYSNWIYFRYKIFSIFVKDVKMDFYKNIKIDDNDGLNN